MKNSEYLIIAAIIALLTGTHYYFSQNSTPFTYTGAPYLMSIVTGSTPLEGLLYGWPVNGTLLLVDYQTAQKFLVGTSSQFIESHLWHNIPRHPFTITDPNAMVIYVEDEKTSYQYYIVINGTKLPFVGGNNQTRTFGINQDQIAHTTKAYADTIPTSQYWLTLN